MDVDKNTEILNSKNVKPDYGFSGGFLTVAQNIGKSLVYPIAVLPIAALLLRFGVMFESLGSDSVNGELSITIPVLYWFGFLMEAPGNAIFGGIGLPLIFAIGVSFGFSKDHRGEAALAGAVGYLVLYALVQVEGSLTTMFYGNSFLTYSNYDGQYYSKLLYIVPNGAQPVWLLNLGVFGGIEAGLISAYLYNRFSNTKLPPALGFFSGRRFVPMVVVISMIGVSIITAAIWPWIQFGLVEFSIAIVKIPWLGAGIYAFLNRLLIPFGLHNVLNAFFWFQMPITHNGDQVFVMTSNGATPLLGDINTYLSAGTYVTDGIMVNGQIYYNDQAWIILQESHVGAFQTGYFPIMMGGVPAVALAIGMTADKENRSAVLTFMMSAAAISVLTGITEPVEFSFMFVSPILYLCYAALSGVVASATVATGVSFGFGFSAGLIDLLASAPVAVNLSTTGWYSYLIIFAIIVVVFPIYYAMAYSVILYTDAPTPGRNGNNLGVFGEDQGLQKDKGKNHKTSKTQKDQKYIDMAKKTVDLVGGFENIYEIDSCITRVRLRVKDNNIKQEDAKNIGYIGYSKVGKNAAQFILGPDAEIVANEITNLKSSGYKKEEKSE